MHHRKLKKLPPFHLPSLPPSLAIPGSKLFHILLLNPYHHSLWGKELDSEKNNNSQVSYSQAGGRQKILFTKVLCGWNMK